MKLSVVIPTILRPTLENSINSAITAGFDEIVIIDDSGENEEYKCSNNKIKYFKLGRNFGRMSGLYYGQIAISVGAYLTTADFMGQLGDDDEYLPETSKILKAAVENQPDIDMWVPGIMRNNGEILCTTPELLLGNISHVFYKPEIFAFAPMYHIPEDNQNWHDFTHAKHCFEKGYKLGWLGEVCVKIRPKLNGNYGRGKIVDGEL